MITAAVTEEAVPLSGDLRTGSDERGFYIRTYTGKQFFWDDIERNVFDIRDIAHALSMNCRWTGHVREFYSVAQHSVHVARNVPVQHRLAALLHDATEAYVHDTPSPLKWYLKEKGFTQFAELEQRVDQALWKWFKLDWPRDPLIKEADLRMLATEHRDLMPKDTNGYGDEAKERKYMVEPYPWHIDPWPPKVAETVFLHTFHLYRPLED